jgi:glycosyltransferase involved in cell wall biosynthesis
VLAADWPHETLEILVIDHASTDTTADMARAAGAKVLSLSNGKIGAARNAGLYAASGEFIAYVDADCTVPSTWIRTAIGLMNSDTTIAAVGGPCLSPADGTWVEKSLAPSNSKHRLVKRAMSLATSSFITRSSLLKKLGGFDETLASGEDDDMSNRIRQSGATLLSATDCHIVHHGYPKTWKALIAKERWHGSNHIEVRSEFDLILFLTSVFLVSSLSIPILAIWALFGITTVKAVFLLAGFVLQAAPPFLYAGKRIYQFPNEARLGILFAIAGYLFFIGHSIGVTENLWRRVRSRLRFLSGNSSL